MHYVTYIAIFSSALLLPTLGSYCNSDISYVIRNRNTSYVLDAKETEVTMEAFDGYSSQLWTFECASRPGTFYIINSYNQHALDVDIATASQLVTNIYEGTLYQEWYLNSNGTIVNAQLDKTICTGTYDAGIQLSLHFNYLTPAYEIFDLQEINEALKNII